MFIVLFQITFMAHSFLSTRFCHDRQFLLYTYVRVVDAITARSDALRNFLPMRAW